MMRQQPIPSNARGFSLIELILVMAIFLTVSGAAFALLEVAQQRYRSEQDFLESVQNARLGVEMIVRDVHNAGYPRPFSYTGTPNDIFAAPADLQRRFAIPFGGLQPRTAPWAAVAPCPTASTWRWN